VKVLCESRGVKETNRKEGAWTLALQRKNAARYANTTKKNTSVTYNFLGLIVEIELYVPNAA